jgi:hypothetical protein
MVENRAARVEVELEQSDGTISGLIAVDGGPPATFFGWLDLIDRLERAGATSSGELPAPAGQSGSGTQASPV